MVDPTFLSDGWNSKDGFVTGPQAYYSPCLVYRSNHPHDTAPDQGFQMLVLPEGDGLYALARLDFTLPHYARQRSGDPENLTLLEHGLDATEAVTKAYAVLGREFELAKHYKRVTPQAVKHRIPVDLPDARPLAKLPGLATTADRAGLDAALQRLSSQWGKKTTNYQDLPRPKHRPGDFSWS